VNTTDWTNTKDLIYRSLKDYWVAFMKSNDLLARSLLDELKANNVDLSGWPTPEPYTRWIKDSLRQNNKLYAELWRRAMFWFRIQVHLGTRKPHVEDIPAIFLKERYMMFDKGTGLLVPYNEAFGPDPLPEEHYRVIDSAVEAGKAPANVLISGGSTLILGELGTSSRAKRSDLEAKALSSYTTHAKFMPAALDQAEKWDRSAPGSLHSASDSVQRCAGLLLE
jgi:hypothetical protein